MHWPKSLFRFLHSILQKIPNELSGQPNICILFFFLKYTHKHTHTHTPIPYTDKRATHFHFSPDICIPTCTGECRVTGNTVTSVYELCLLSRWPVLEATCRLPAFLRPIQAIVNVHSVWHLSPDCMLAILPHFQRQIHSLIDAFKLWCCRRPL